MGGASDTILQQNISLGAEYLKKLILCISVLIVMPGCLSLCGEILMTKASLWHGRVVLDRYFNKSYDSVQKIKKSEAQYRLEDDQTELGIVWVRLLTKCIALPVIVSFFLYRSIRILGWYTLIVILVSMIKLVIPLGLRKKLSIYDKKNREFESTVRNYELDIAEHPCQIELLGIQKCILKKVENIYEAYFLNSFIKNIKLQTFMEYLLNGTGFFCELILLFIGAFAVAKGALTPGNVITMITYFGVFNIVIEYFSFIIQNILVLFNIVDRLLIFYEDEEKRNNSLNRNISEIQFCNVNFSYDGTAILNKFNMEIGKEEKVVLTGRNGSGKSTIVKLVMGLYASYGGKINVNGNEIRNISREDLNRQIAYVEQTPFVFEGSVKENISFGDSNASSEQVNEIAEKLNITELLEKDVGQLSGGELQKVAVARALIKKGSVLILDEPTNNLDTESVSWLEEFIRDYQGMLIFVSHEGKLIRLADKVIKL